MQTKAEIRQTIDRLPDFCLGLILLSVSILQVLVISLNLS